MVGFTTNLICIFFQLVMSCTLLICQNITRHTRPPWLLHVPKEWRLHSSDADTRSSINASAVTEFVTLCNRILHQIDGFTDGEILDAIEHFFWLRKDGMALELGSLDGSIALKSMTYNLEEVGWRRILVDGDPKYRESVVAKSPNAFSANAAICQNQGKVHFHKKDYVGGIVEFMSQDFMKSYHPEIYWAGIPPGNISSIDFAKLAIQLKNKISEIDCVPLTTILHKAHAPHVNFFILDVEGGELEVLKSINWAVVKFEILCIETEPSNRPPGYADAVTRFMEKRGYRNITGQVGRNIWYAHPAFVPSIRPGLSLDCFNGMRKAAHADLMWVKKGRVPKFQMCPTII